VSISIVGALLIFVGFILLGMAVLTWDGDHEGHRVEGGGFVIVGPFPIIFGTNRRAVKALYVAALIIIAIYFILCLMR